MYHYFLSRECTSNSNKNGKNQGKKGKGKKKNLAGKSFKTDAVANVAGPSTAATTKIINSEAKQIERLTQKLAQRDKRIARIKEEAQIQRPFIKQMMGTFANAADGGVVSPADADFMKTGHSGYLHSLLVPDEGPCSIPDDLVRLHTIRPETITINIDATNPDPSSNKLPTCSGLLILYPNHPTSLVGYNYLYNANVDDPLAANYQFDQILYVAQELSESYDYGRRTSQVLNVQCTNIPSGVYALSGTMNAVRVDGMLSELNLYPTRTTLYDQLLQNTTNLFDKIGGVKVGDGVTVLSLPDTFLNPYTRLGDAIPNSYLGWDTVESATIVDVSQDLLYKSEVSDAGTSISATPQWTINMNVDSTTGFHYDIPFQFQMNDLPGSTDTYTVDTAMAINVYDTFTNPIGTIVLSQPLFTYSSGDDVDLNFSFSGFWDPLTDSLSGDDVGPIGVVQVTISQTWTTTASFPVPNSYTASSTPMITIPLGARPGVNQSIVLIAYQGLPSGAQLTLGGVTNYELVPNPELRKNLKTTYGKYDPMELNLVKYVMCNRERFNIRSVLPMPMYDTMKVKYREFATSPHKVLPEVAGALTWGDIKNFGKRAITQAGDVFKFLGSPEGKSTINGVTSVLSNAASGSPMRSFAATKGVKLEKLLMPVRHKKIHARAVDAIPPPAIRPRKIKSLQKNQVAADRAVAFPTLLTNAANEALGFDLYVTVPGHLAGFDKNVARSIDGYTVWGLVRNTGIEFPIGCDQTLLRVDPKHFPALVPMPQLDVVGNSCDGAMWLCGHAKFEGVYPVAITGEVKFGANGPILLRNPYFQIKQTLCNQAGVVLIGRSADSRPDVEDLKEFTRFRSDFPKPDRTCLKSTCS